jgi:hypothetical protein
MMTDPDLLELVESPPQLYCPACGTVLGLAHDAKKAAVEGVWHYEHFRAFHPGICKNNGKRAALPVIKRLVKVL